MAISECTINNLDVLAPAVTIDFEEAIEADEALESEKASDTSPGAESTLTEGLMGNTALGKDGVKNSSLMDNGFLDSISSVITKINNEIMDILCVPETDRQNKGNPDSLDLTLKIQPITCKDGTKNALAEVWDDDGLNIDKLISEYLGTMDDFNVIGQLADNVHRLKALQNAANSFLTDMTNLLNIKPSSNSCLNKVLDKLLGSNSLENGMNLKLTAGILDDALLALDNACDLMLGNTTLSKLKNGGIKDKFPGNKGTPIVIVNNYITQIAVTSIIMNAPQGSGTGEIMSTLLNNQEKIGLSNDDLLGGLRTATMNSKDKSASALLTASVIKTLRENGKITGTGSSEIVTKEMLPTVMSGIAMKTDKSNSPISELTNIKESLTIMDSTWEDNPELLDNNPYMFGLCKKKVSSDMPDVTTNKDNGALVVSTNIDTNKKILILNTLHGNKLELENITKRNYITCHH